MVWVASGMGVLLILIVVFSGWLLEASDRAARGLADRQRYVAAVRGSFEPLPRVIPPAPPSAEPRVAKRVAARGPHQPAMHAASGPRAAGGWGTAAAEARHGGIR
jgi:hypothetical protein